MPDDFISRYQEIERQLYLTALGYLRNTEDARDALQNAVVAAYKAYEKLKYPEYFKTWMTRIVINKCNDLLKRRRPSEELTDGLGILSELPEEELELMDAILKLGQPLSRFLVLRFYNGLTYRETSVALNMPQSTVKHRTNIALEKLRKLLEGDDAK